MKTTTTHADYPHEPGQLWDCPACMATCHCGDDPWTAQCVHCAAANEAAANEIAAAVGLINAITGPTPTKRAEAEMKAPIPAHGYEATPLTKVDAYVLGDGTLVCGQCAADAPPDIKPDVEPLHNVKGQLNPAAYGAVQYQPSDQLPGYMAAVCIICDTELWLEKA